MNQWIFVASAVLALLVIVYNGKAIQKIHNHSVKGIALGLLTFTALRYISLIIYSDAPSLALLERLRYFYFASSLGLTMVTVLAVWYVIPSYRELKNPLHFFSCFIPWMLFYIYLIIAQPTSIEKGTSFGYVLVLNENFRQYLSIAQISFILVISALCLKGIIKYKHLQIRVQLIIVLIAQALLMSDGLSYSINRLTVFAPFTLTEAFAFMATYYCFSQPIKSIKHYEKGI